MTSIFDLSKEITRLDARIVKVTKEKDSTIRALQAMRAKMQETLDNHLRGVDADKMDLGATCVYVRGNPISPQRKGVIKNAITDLLNTKGANLKKTYFGMKNYEGFGDQGCDCEYGMGPTYGSIVFEVGITPEYRKKDIPDALLEAAIYYLANYKHRE